MDRKIKVNSLVEALKYYSELTPDKLMAVDSSSEYTYKKAWKMVLCTKCALERLGIGRYDCVLVQCTQDVRFVIIDMACELLGAIFVPTEDKASSGRINMMIEESEAKVFINNGIDGEKTNNINIDLFFEDILKNVSDSDWDNNYNSEFSLPASEDIAQILYTTGTTGKSKGIEISHANNIALAENIIYGTEMKDNNVEILPLPLSHSHGLRSLYANLLNGSTVVLIDGVADVKNFFSLIDKYKVTSVDLSPTAAKVLIALARMNLAQCNDTFDYIEIGTAALNENIKGALCEILPDVRLYNFYGSTESGRTCALNFNSENRENCIGKPTVNASFIVTDRDRNPIKSSKENMGLLASCGAMNMVGYYKQPDLTASIMNNGFVYTNDLGYIDEEGYVYVLGREDDVINFKGIKISPDEIESEASKYIGIKDCCCVGKTDRMSGQVPVLFIVCEDEKSFDMKAFMQHLEHMIDSNKVPNDIRIIEEIPRTYNGKLQRKILKATLEK